MNIIIDKRAVQAFRLPLMMLFIFHLAFFLDELSLYDAIQLMAIDVFMFYCLTSDGYQRYVKMLEHGIFLIPYGVSIFMLGATSSFFLRLPPITTILILVTLFLFKDDYKNSLKGKDVKERNI